MKNYLVCFFFWVIHFLHEFSLFPPFQIEEIAKYLHHQSPLSLQTVLLEHGLLSLLSSTLLGPQPSLSSFPPRWWDLESEESNNYKALGVCLRLTGLVLACPGVGWMVSVSPKVVQEVVLGKRSLLQDHSEANNEGGEKRGICFFNALVHYLGHYEGGIGGKRKRGEEGSKRVVGIHPLAGVRDNAVRALYSLLLRFLFFSFLFFLFSPH